MFNPFRSAQPQPYHRCSNSPYRSGWQEEGGLSLHERARQEVERLVAAYEPPALARDVQNEMTKLMEREAGRYGLDRLPALGLR